MDFDCEVLRPTTVARSSRQRATIPRMWLQHVGRTLSGALTGRARFHVHASLNHTTLCRVRDELAAPGA